MNSPVTELSEVRGDNLKRIQESQGWNNKQMGDAAGVSPQTISNCINVRSNVSKNVVALVLKNLQVPESWLDTDHRGAKNVVVPELHGKAIKEFPVVPVAPALIVESKMIVHLSSDTVNIRMEVSKEKAIAFLASMINE